MDNGHVSLFFDIFFVRHLMDWHLEILARFLIKNLGLSNYLLKIEQNFSSIFIMALVSLTCIVISAKPRAVVSH